LKEQKGAGGAEIGLLVEVPIAGGGGEKKMGTRGARPWEKNEPEMLSKKGNAKQA